jgi:hypothetical protein
MPSIHSNFNCSLNAVESKLAILQKQVLDPSRFAALGILVVTL